MAHRLSVREDYKLFATPPRRVGVETYADNYLMRYIYPGGHPADISRYWMNRFGADPNLALAISSGIGVFSMRTGHDYTGAWEDMRNRHHISQLGSRVVGQVVERLAFLEDAHDGRLDVSDARREWNQARARRLSQEERRSHEVSKEENLSDEFFTLILDMSHQAWYQVINSVTPLQYGDETWQVALPVPKSISKTIGRGEADVLGISKHTDQSILMDIKCNQYSICRSSSAPWSPKNQAQLLMYFLIISMSHLLDEDCELPQPTTLVAVNPMRGVMEFIKPEVLLQEVQVLRTLATRAFCLDARLVERLISYLVDVLADAI